MEPRIVKQLIDEEGNIIRDFDTVIRRKVISQEARAKEAKNLGFSNIISPNEVKSITQAIKLGFTEK